MLDHVTVISLEPWDDTWRRNQHLAHRLVDRGHVRRLTWISPPRRGLLPSSWSPSPGITVLVPAMPVPRRLGGLSPVARTVARKAADSSVLWVNDPRLGAAVAGSTDLPALYDVTDDWRTYPFPSRIVRGIVRAEDALAARATTVVCSEVLAQRWQQRYGVQPRVVHNGVDLRAHTAATGGYPLPGAAPHVGYVGTLQPERLDIALVLATAALDSVGSVHLVGPDALDDAARSALRAAPKVHLHPPVPASRVPDLMASMDLLMAPHTVNPFTASLDAIKAYEYAAAGRPVVATPTSGFGALQRWGAQVGLGEAFLGMVDSALTVPSQHAVRPVPGSSWDERADAFAAALLDAVDRRGQAQHHHRND